MNITIYVIESYKDHVFLLIHFTMLDELSMAFSSSLYIGHFHQQNKKYSVNNFQNFQLSLVLR